MLLVVGAQTFAAFSLAAGCSKVNETSGLSNIGHDWRGTQEVHEKMEPRKFILLQSVRLLGAVEIEHDPLNYKVPWNQGVAAAHQIQLLILLTAGT